MLGGVSVSMRFFMFVFVIVFEASVGVEPDEGALKSGGVSRRGLLCGASVGTVKGRMLLGIEVADSAVSIVDLSEHAIEVGIVMDTCATAGVGGALTSAGADMVAGKLSRQFPKRRPEPEERCIVSVHYSWNPSTQMDAIKKGNSTLALAIFQVRETMMDRYSEDVERRE